MLRRFSDIGVLVDGNILLSLSIYSFSLLYEMEEVSPLDSKRNLGLMNL